MAGVKWGETYNLNTIYPSTRQHRQARQHSAGYKEGSDHLIPHEGVAKMMNEYIVLTWKGRVKIVLYFKTAVEVFDLS